MPCVALAGGGGLSFFVMLLAAIPPALRMSDSSQGEDCTMRRMHSIFASRSKDPRAKRPILRRIGVCGFTIIELAIVIEIIGFLATIVMSNFYRSKKAAEVAVTVQNIQNVQTALASYYAMESQFPPTLNSICVALPPSSSITRVFSP